MSYWYDQAGGAPASMVRRWWTSDKNEVHRHLWGVVEELAKNQEYNRARDLHHAKMYGGINLRSLDPYGYSTSSENSERIGYNVIESAIDTILSDTVAQKPRPMFLTEGGDTAQQKRAKRMSKFVSGQFYASGVHGDVMPRVCLDALVFGTGIAKVYLENGKPRAERVPAHEVIVDDAECYTREPTKLYHVKRVPRDSLAAHYPEKKELIAKAEADTIDGPYEDAQDMLLVVEGWRLPTSPDANDGRWVVALKEGTLVDEEWRRPDLPFVVLRYKRRLHGFRGKGVAEILNSKQIALNFLLFKLNEKIRGWANTIFVRPGSQLNAEHLTNEEWNIVETNEPPTVVQPQSIPSDLFAAIETMKSDCYAEVGVSTLAARAEMPAGMVNASGRAIRLMSDRASRRFVDFLQQWEEAHLDLARQFIMLTKEAVEDGDADSASVLAPDDNNKGAERIDWSDVALDEENYIMKCHPTSFLSGTPQGKLADIGELVSVLPEYQEHAASLMDYPDLEAVSSVVNAPREAVRNVVDYIAETGEYIAPEPAMDLQTAGRYALAVYWKEKMNDAPEEVLEALRMFMDGVKRLLEPPAPPPGAIPQQQQQQIAAPQEMQEMPSDPSLPMGPQ